MRNRQPQRKRISKQTPSPRKTCAGNGLSARESRNGRFLREKLAQRTTRIPDSPGSHSGSPRPGTGNEHRPPQAERGEPGSTAPWNGTGHRNFKPIGAKPIRPSTISWSISTSPSLTVRLTGTAVHRITESWALPHPSAWPSNVQDSLHPHRTDGPQKHAAL